MNYHKHKVAINWIVLILIGVTMGISKKFVFAGAAILFFLFILRLANQKWGRFKPLSRGIISPAQNFISEVYKTQKEYCLILRPFGNDSFFSLKNIKGETHVESLFINTWNNITIEQTIEKVVNSYNNVETVALVDPRLLFVPGSPMFLSTSNETWQWVIFDLLKRALWVFIIIPENTKITDALVWEVNKIMELGLMGRFMIILPPSSVFENKRIIEEIKEKLFFISDQLDFMEDGTIMIYPNEGDSEVFIYNGWYQLPTEQKKKYMQVLPLSKYEAALKNTIKSMNAITSIQSFEERYIFSHKEFSNDDYTMSLSKEYLQLYLRKRNKW